jgi:putative transcriptional regulator
MPNLADPNFSESLTLICEHNPQGALGFVINRPAGIPLSDLLEQQDIPFTSHPGVTDVPLYQGGPVDIERGFILHSPEKQWSTTMPVSEEFSITSSRDIIEDTLKGEGPRDLMYLLGYAGWGAGQLEEEMATNAWLTTQASADIVFHTPPQDRWKAAASQLGIDLTLLNSDAGHA